MHRIFSFLYSISYLAVIFLLMTLILVAIAGTVFGEFSSNFVELMGVRLTLDKLENTTFGLILAGITIILATSIIVPKYLLHQAVEDHLREIEGEISQKIEKKYLELSDHHVNTTDAHLSRMIGLLILRDAQLSERIQAIEKHDNSRDLISIYIWAAGWSLRSYKNYLRITVKTDVMGESVRIYNYRDLVIQNIYIVKAVKDRVFQTLDIDFSAPLNFSSVNTLLRKIGKSPYEDDWVSLLLRTVKEAIDSEYYYEFEFEELGYRKDSDITEISDKFFMQITPLTVLLIILLLAEYRLREVKKDARDLTGLILSKSSYRENKKFAEKLESVLEKIQKEMNNKKITLDKINKTTRIFKYTNKFWFSN